MTSIKRDYKSSMFCMLWENKTQLLSLYNAVNGTHYTNMPLRDLFYVAQVLQGMIKDENLYGTSLFMIPTPKFVVFYNGTVKQPERRTLRLSDSFTKQNGEVNLELIVEVINVNPGNNEELLSNCRQLQEYVWYIEKVRKYAADMSIEAAVERAVNECIQEGILADFLLQNKAEAIAMSIYEYDQEAHMRLVRREGYEEGMSDGITQGVIQSILELLEDLGDIPLELQARILSEENLQQLKAWHKLAAKADSIEQFWENI